MGTQDVNFTYLIHNCGKPCVLRIFVSPIITNLAFYRYFSMASIRINVTKDDSSIYMRGLGQFIKTALDSYAVGARSAPVREAHTHTA